MMASLPIAVTAFAMTTLNNMPYTFGGVGGYWQSGGEQNVYMFSFDINKWLNRARIPVPTANQAAVALDDDTALMCGGDNALTGSAYRVCFIYAASTNAWTAYKWSMNEARIAHGMAVYKGRVYVYGGYDRIRKKAFSSAEILSESKGWDLMLHGLANADQNFANVVLTADDCHYYCECKKNSSTLCVGGVNCECNLTANGQNNTGNHLSVNGIRQITNTSNNPFYGILINGNGGTQVFDFDYYPYSTGNHQLGLHIKGNATKFGSRAVLIGNLVYFAGTDGSLDVYGE
jgi:hypothetical protein